MAGVLTAYFLKQQGLDVVVLEADRIAGDRQKTPRQNYQPARPVLRAADQKAGVSGLACTPMPASRPSRTRELIGRESISCHFERLPLLSLYH